MQKICRPHDKDYQLPTNALIQKPGDTVGTDGGKGHSAPAITDQG